MQSYYASYESEQAQHSGVSFKKFFFSLPFTLFQRFRPEIVFSFADVTTTWRARARLGASVTMAQIARSEKLAAIAPAARAVGGPAVRNMATVGGNLLAASPYGDFAVALVALRATIHFAESEMEIDEFLEARDGIVAERGIVTGVSFVVPAAGEFRFSKVSRVKPKGVSVLSIAAVIKGSGTVESAGIGLGAMADRPMRAKAAEAALAGSDLSEEGIAEAVRVIGEGTAPATDPVASSWYRAEVLPVHFRRLMLG